MKNVFFTLTIAFSVFFTFGFGYVLAADIHQHHGHHNAKDFATTEFNIESAKIIKAMHAPMHKQEPSNTKSVEIDFLNDMIPHHQGAIDSANLLLPHTKKNAKLAELAQNIIKTQESEITEFKDLIANKGVSTTKISSKEYKNFNEKNTKAMATMMHRMEIKQSGNIAKDFLVAMIAHHQGAIDTSSIVLEYTKDEKVRKIAQTIIDAQQNEIALMQKLIQEIDKKTK